MAIVNTVQEILQTMKTKLYVSNFQNSEGKYIARTDSNASYTVEDVCAAMKNRGGFAGDPGHAADIVKHYLREAAYQLCNGNTVNAVYFTIQPIICGTFNSLAEAQAAEKEIGFRFRPLLALRKLVSDIVVVVTGIADTNGDADEFIDVTTGAVNEVFTPGGQFVLTGNKIKVAGDDSSVGVYFTSVDEPGKEVKVTGQLAENSPSKIIGIIPTQVQKGKWRITVKTQAGSGNSLLKTLRVITGKAVLESA